MVQHVERHLIASKRQRSLLCRTCFTDVSIETGYPKELFSVFSVVKAFCNGLLLQKGRFFDEGWILYLFLGIKISI